MTDLEKPDPLATPPGSRPVSVAHHVQSLAFDLAHLARHTALAQHATSEASKAFNIEHVKRHAANSIEDLRKLTAALRVTMPGVGAELDALIPLADPDSAGAIPERSMEYQRGYAAEQPDDSGWRRDMMERRR